jgi:hypothetical protein
VLGDKLGFIKPSMIKLPKTIGADKAKYHLSLSIP